LGKRAIEKAVNVDDLRRLARRRVPRPVVDAIDGAAADEVTAGANRSAFDNIWFRPRAMVDVSVRDPSTVVLGRRIAMPLMLDPCGFARMANSEAE
jgi:isopentenyl diphosphate isomerase/L-lactate dehydrogenase-like FMN-dependent dehydrogenase